MKYSRDQICAREIPSRKKFWTLGIPTRKNFEPVKARWHHGMRPTRSMVVQDPRNLAHSINLWEVGLPLYLKRDSCICVFLWIFQISSEQFFIEHLWTATSVLRKNRHFRPNLIHWNESVYWSIKNAIQQGVGQLSTTNHFWVMKVFVKSIAPFFGQNKYTNIRRRSTIFCHKIRIFCLQKVQ